MKSIEIKNPAINQEKIAAQLKTTAANIPDLENLASSGSTQLRRKHVPEDSEIENIRLMINFIPDTILKEPKFVSSAPVIGSLIVILRNTWNWMSTKWYVLPIMLQQSNINAKLLVFLMNSAQLQDKQAKQIAELETRVAQLETLLNREQEQ